MQDDLDPAKKYFTEMLAMQTTQMMWKKQLVQLKIKTEFLKQELLKKQLNLNDEETELSARVVVENEESSSDSEDDNWGDIFTVESLNLNFWEPTY